MTEQLVLRLASIIILGIAAQWLAWRLHLPSILLLLLGGLVVGPVTGFLGPDVLFSELLLPIVSLSVAVILFEGGLSLSITEFREFGSVVRNLMAGIFATWLIGAGAAYLILRLDLPLAILLSAILVVTGPTVIMPLLRQVRPVGQMGSIAK
jgi:NhaP-type Na+/H+ or K+/H+ antiporter